MNSLLNTLKGLLLLLVVVCVAGFTALFLQGQFALRGLEHAAVQMGDGKDIVADILPPPLYIIEAHLVAYQLLDTPVAERTALAQRFKQLKKDFDDRNAYWQGKRQDVDSVVTESLLGAQKSKGEAYWDRLEKAFLPALLAGRDDEARHAFAELGTLYTAHRNGVDATVKVAGSWAEARLADLSATTQRTLWILSAVAALCVVVAIAIYLVVAGRVSRLLGAEPEELRSEMVRLAAGDLRPSLKSAVEGSVFGALKHAQERIRALVEQTSRQSQTVDSQVTGVQLTLSDLERNANELADTAMATSAAMEEISASIAMILDQANHVEGAVAEAGRDAARGNQAREDNLASVERIAQASKRAQDSVAVLGEHSKEVTGIVQTIRAIAEQTNLLALNAAIEAARAGEQGRGFAVVADEVRKLAESTTTATEEISKLIGTIHSGIGDAVQAINASVKDIDAGRRSAGDAGAALLSIRDRIEATVAAVADIVGATREVDAATRQIAGNMSRVSSLADSGNAASRNTAQAGRVLGDVSVQLNQALKAFSY